MLGIAPRFGQAQHARVAADVFSPVPENHDPGIFPDPVGQLERVVGPVLEDNAAPRGAAGVGAGAVQRQTVMDADPAGLRLDRRDAAGAVFPYLGLATAAAEQAIFAYVVEQAEFCASRESYA